MKRAVLWAVMVGLFCHWAMAEEPKPAAAENLIIVTLDGLRWQEVFGGFDPLLTTKEAGGLTDLVNGERSGIPCGCGWDPSEPFHGLALTEREKFINELLARTTRNWIDEPPDSFTMEAAMEYFVRHRPRVFYLMLGETDDWA